MLDEDLPCSVHCTKLPLTLSPILKLLWASLWGELVASGERLGHSIVFPADPEVPFSWSEEDISDLYDHTTVLFAAEGKEVPIAMHPLSLPVQFGITSHPLSPLLPRNILPEQSAKPLPSVMLGSSPGCPTGPLSRSP